jgi:hypothetical protein
MSNPHAVMLRNGGFQTDWCNEWNTLHRGINENS